MDYQFMLGLALSCLGGLSTSIGALLVIVNPAPNLKMLGLIQGFAAGLMLSISFFDLVHNALNALGFLKGNLWFFAGVIFFAVVSKFIPEPPASAPISDDKSRKKGGDERNKDIMKKRQRQVLLSGIITAIGISLHNFPEGMAVAFELVLTFHWRSLYTISQSKWEAFKLASLSGFAEPLGVIIIACLFPSSLSSEILEGLLGAVGGVMAFLTLHEMLPLAFDYAGQKQSVKAVFCGMAFMSASLYFLHISIPEDLGIAGNALERESGYKRRL
ncbi:hypothetical protein Lal_00029134 [Lupinus albus]|nr:hypothetical protein Lal_00029134 [Lupinus albus]